MIGIGPWREFSASRELTPAAGFASGAPGMTISCVLPLEPSMMVMVFVGAEGLAGVEAVGPS